MQSAKEKISDMAASAKEHSEIYKAKVDEKVEKSMARTKEEKKIAEERRKAREAEAKMHMHQAKATHGAETRDHKLRHGHVHDPLHPHHHGTAATAFDPLAAPAAGTGTHGHVIQQQPPPAGTHGYVIQQQPPPAGTMNPLAHGGTGPTYPPGSQYPSNQYL